MQPSNFNAWAALVNTPDRQITFNGRAVSVDGVLSAESYAAVLRQLTGNNGTEVSVSSSVTLAAAYEPAQQIAIRLVAGEDYGNARAISFRLDGSDTSVQEVMAAINRQSAATGVVAERDPPRIPYSSRILKERTSTL